MRTRFLKHLWGMIIIILVIGMLSGHIYGQIIDSVNYLTSVYCPVWSLIGIGAPWWATTHISEPTVEPLGYQWPQSMILPYAAGLGSYGVSGFAGIGLASIQPPSMPPAQGFSAIGLPIVQPLGIPPTQGFTTMAEIPPCFGLSIGLGMGAFGGLGMTGFGSPEAISNMGIPWNWQPFFGLTSTGPGYYYLGMYSPWWSFMQPINSF